MSKESDVQLFNRTQATLHLVSCLLSHTHTKCVIGDLLDVELTTFCRKALHHVFFAPERVYSLTHTHDAKLNSAEHQSGQPTGKCLSTAVNRTGKEETPPPPTHTHRN